MSASKRFDQYMAHLSLGLGHADRHAGLKGYCTGLMLPLSRKSVEPMAARMAPERVQAVLSVKAVEGSAIGTVYLLERASDGAQVSVEVAGRGVGASVHAVGTVVTCSVIGTGVILSVAGEALAFVPNALGRALLHNERL